jgi:uncharacterized protein (DUF1015 family)
MATVAPLRGLRYQINNADELARLVTPPYDVISQEQQDNLYDNDLHNIIRLELNRKEAGDDDKHNVYTRARDFLRLWIEEGVLRTESKSSIYINETTFTDAFGAQRTRCGFFARLRLEDFSKNIVLPHERTFSGHKKDRLQLLKATKTNISPIMTLYPDPQNAVQQALAASQPRLLAQFTDPAGWRQSLLAVDEPDKISAVQELMQPKQIFIADGHHRYETGLNYRDYIKSLNPAGFSENAPYAYILAYMCSMSDPGLTVFASHRVLPKWKNLSLPDLFQNMGQYFTIEEHPLTGNLANDTDTLRFHLNRAGVCKPAYGLVVKGQPNFWVFLLKTGALEQARMRESEPVLKCLDVVILSELLLGRGLGIANENYDQVDLISYISGLSKAIAAVAAGEAELAFLLNPTKIEQVRAVAQKGFMMPRKSTYFYPKILTGLVLNSLESE